MILGFATLMKRRGIEALYRQPNTSKPAPGAGGLPRSAAQPAGDASELSLAMGITYIPMARGFVYLTAVVNWLSRKVLAWRLSITKDTAFCIEAVEDAIVRFSKG